MDLCEIERMEQFQEYYAENDLIELDAKIEHLKGKMCILAVRCDDPDEKMELLLSLEESVLDGHWQAFSVQ